jgi:molybdate transport system substrate-binding protein
MRIAVQATALAITVLLLGCDGKEPPGSGAQTQPAEMLLYCGAGLRPVADELVHVFASVHNVRIVTDYAGSEVLLAKMRLVRKGDLYMPGDRYYVDQAAQASMVLSQRPVCYFVPTILVQKGNPKSIHSLSDLTGPGLKIGLGDPQACAIGRKTRQLLDKNHISWHDIEGNVVFQSLTVNELGLQIQAKALDAVIVWDAIAKYYRNEGTEIAIPAQMNVISTIDIAVLSFAESPESAEQFVDFAASEQGKAIFRKHLYTVEPPQ